MDITEQNFNTILNLIIQKKEKNAILLLDSFNEDVFNYIDIYGCTLLTWACKKNLTDLAIKLIPKTKLINKKTKYNSNSLSMAKDNTNIKLVVYLLNS